MRTKRSQEFKAKVVLAGIRGNRTLSELASLCGVRPNQITVCKREAQEQTVFDL